VLELVCAPAHVVVGGLGEPVFEHDHLATRILACEQPVRVDQARRDSVHVGRDRRQQIVLGRGHSAHAELVEVPMRPITPLIANRNAACRVMARSIDHDTLAGMPTLAELSEVFQQVFDDDELVVTRDTTAADVEGWDSLTHVSLLLALEKRFAIRFKSGQVAALKSVGELADLIETLQRK
jgi:acyl carrier protein